MASQVEAGINKLDATGDADGTAVLYVEAGDTVPDDDDNPPIPE